MQETPHMTEFSKKQVPQSALGNIKMLPAKSFLDQISILLQNITIFTTNII